MLGNIAGDLSKVIKKHEKDKKLCEDILKNSKDNKKI